jgi:hypothetical protein
VKSRILVSDNVRYPIEMRISALDALLRASICLCDLQSCREKQTAGRNSTAGNMKIVQVYTKDVYKSKKTVECS